VKRGEKSDGRRRVREDRGRLGQGLCSWGAGQGRGAHTWCVCVEQSPTPYTQTFRCGISSGALLEFLLPSLEIAYEVEMSGSSTVWS